MTAWLATTPGQGEISNPGLNYEGGYRMWQRTTYTDNAAHTQHEALYLTWDQVEEILGHRHQGDPDDDRDLIAYLQANGAPAWVADASGWIDEQGWGLIGPEIPQE